MGKKHPDLPQDTVEVLKLLAPKLGEFHQESDEFSCLLTTLPEDRVDALGIGTFSWAPVYELTFQEHCLWVIYLIGRLDFVKSASKVKNPNRVILEEFKADLSDDWEDRFPDLGDKQLLISLTVALQRSILSVFLHQKSLSCLVAEVREGRPNAYRALFDAVRLDRSITACPSIAARISKAELQNDKAFFQHLRNPLKGPFRKHWKGYRDLRFSFAVLREMGFDSLSDDQLEQLFVHSLKLYPKDPNARRNLRKQLSASKNIKPLG